MSGFADGTPAVPGTEWALARDAPGPSGRQTAHAGRPGQDLAERIGERRARVAGPGLVPPGDEPVGTHQDRAVAGDLAMAQPGAARVIQVAVEVADPHRVERQARFGGKLQGCFAPGLAVLAGDQQEPPRRDEIGTTAADW